ncbi:MAG TPA: STAS domain-containing protein [Chitinivibrionales bacterium]|nr:STAS domain-containing protein [Chitinivibrionales bacterium]
MKYEISDAGKFAMIRIVGNIDDDQVTQQLDKDISAYIRRGRRHFAFNLEKITYLNSPGIGLFVHCLCDVQERKGSVSIIANSSDVQSLLEMVGFNRLMKMYNSEEEFLMAHKIVAS